MLVIRFSSLGDILLTAPALRALRRRFKEAEIHLLTATDYADAASMIRGVDRVLTFDRSTGFSGLNRLSRQLSRCYDIVVDLQNSPRSACLRSLIFPTLWVKANRYRFRRWLLIRFKRDAYPEELPVPLRYLRAVERLGGTDDGEGLRLSVTDADRTWAGRFLSEQSISSGSFVILSPGSRHLTKQWPIERWLELARRLQEEGRSLVIVGAASEREMIDELTGGLDGVTACVGESVSRVGAILEQARAAITHDSGIMHLAAGVDTPLVAIFGPTVKQFGFHPFRVAHVVIENDLPCRPCTAFGGGQCPKNHFRCMLDTSVDRVHAALSGLLKDGSTETTSS